MRKQYDFTKAKRGAVVSVPSGKTRITIRLDEESIGYFKSMSEGVGIPYQSLINLYLRDCAIAHRKLKLGWISRDAVE